MKYRSVERRLGDVKETVQQRLAITKTPIGVFSGLKRHGTGNQHRAAAHMDVFPLLRSFIADVRPRGVVSAKKA